MFGSLRLATRTAASYEDAFLERYSRLRERALGLTRDPAQADDLVQGAFVNFVLSRTPLEDIQNLDAYLYAMLQHMHVSQVRRAVRGRQSPLELVDHDSAAFALKGADAAARLQTSEELGLICEYACNRRMGSKTGSVLLLRFFHGYYVREIAQVLRVPAASVDGLMHLARREARTYISDPSALRPIHPGPIARIARPSPAGAAECLADLRSSIFALAHERCYPQEWFARTFEDGRDDGGLPCDALAGIVTCARCLDEVNHRLGLPPLADRYPVDFLGQDRRSGPGAGSGGGAGAGGGHRIEHLRRAADDVREHRPRELMLAVNGYEVASQRVGSEVTEQSVSVNIPEPMGFVEVFTDQQVRLLYFPVRSGPDGPIEQTAMVELCEKRSAEVTLDLSGTWPRIDVAYRDPRFNPSGSGIGEAGETDDEGARHQPARPARAWWRRAAGWFTSRPWTVPATVGVVLLAVWVANLIVGSPALDAASLVERAVASEQASSRSVTGVEHRVLQLDERGEGDAAARESTRIEVWRDLANQVQAVRAYAGSSTQPTALEVSRAGSPATVYRAGSAPEVIAAGPEAVSSTIESQEFWRFELSASNFQQLVAGLPRGTVEDTGTTYVVRYEGAPDPARGRVVSATLTLAKSGLRPISQIVVVARPGGTREYRCAERAREHLAASPDNARYFEPDSNLAPKPPTETVPNRKPGPEAPPLGADEVASLQVEALYRLNRVQATQGEQVTVAGGRDGVRVEAIVDTPARKREIMTALDPMLGRRGFSADVETVREATALRPRDRTPISIQGVEPRQAQIPVYPDLVRYFVSHPDESWPTDEASRDARINREIVGLGARMLDHSRRGLQRALALDSLISLVPPGTASRLPGAALDQWRSMVREHANAVLDETSALRAELAPIFGQDLGPRTGVEEAGAGASLTDLVRGLLSQVRAQDQSVRAAFTLPSGAGSPAAALTSARFWNLVSRTESLARTAAHAE